MKKETEKGNRKRKQKTKKAKGGKKEESAGKIDKEKSALKVVIYIVCHFPLLYVNFVSQYTCACLKNEEGAHM